MDNSTLLTIIAIATTLQLAGSAVAVVLVMRQAARASAILEALAVDARPVLRRTEAVLDDMQDLAARARRADATAQAVIQRVNGSLDTARAVVLSRVWPILGVARTLKAMAGAFKRRANAADENAEQRFTYEGGRSGR